MVKDVSYLESISEFEIRCKFLNPLKLTRSPLSARCPGIHEREIGRTWKDIRRFFKDPVALKATSRNALFEAKVVEQFG